MLTVTLAGWRELEFVAQHGGFVCDKGTQLACVALDEAAILRQDRGNVNGHRQTLVGA
jgi:hypothetical protein